MRRRVNNDQETRSVKVRDVFIVSYKKRGSGALWNIRVAARNVQLASVVARKHVLQRVSTDMLEKLGYREYGISQATEIQHKHTSYGTGGVETYWCAGDQRTVCQSWDRRN